MNAIRTSGVGLMLLTAYAARSAHGGELQLRVETTAHVPIAGAIVYALPAIAPPRQGLARATIDQVNRQFVPRVSVVQAGTPVEFPNSDNIRHSVYSFSPAKVFTLKLYAGTPAEPVVFDKPGLVVLGCNIHDHMVAWLMVVDTPYFTRTDQAGNALLTRLPPGDYTLRAWHTPMAEDQQVSEPLKIDASGASVTRTLQISAEVDAQEMPEMRH